MKDEKEFLKQYAGLNPEQKKAVDAIDGPVMVIAGPGTGKTTILTLRIANILRQTDTPANGILAITYTDAGVKAIRVKLSGIIGDGAHDVQIHTFHSFASAIIAEYPDHFLHLSGLRHLTDVEQESLVRGIIANPKYSEIRPMGKPDAYIPAIMSAIDFSKREALTPDMVSEHAKNEIERIKNDDSSVSTRGASKGRLKAEAEDRIAKCEKTVLFADVYSEYENKKREAKRMDFNDLIIELLVALRNDTLLLRLIQERFLYLLVDEHQDTNDAQNFIVALIAEFFETPNIFIVGDEKQAIYRFQGASVENFLLLQKRWPAMNLIKLDTNYRSHQSILDASFSMIEKNYLGDEHKSLRIELKSKALEKTKLLEVVTGDNNVAVESYLVRELKSIREREPRASVAIITRRNRDLERVIRLVESAHIPISSERSIDIFHHPVGAVFFDLIEYLGDVSKIDALAKTLAAGLWHLSFEDSVTLIRAIRSGQTSGIEKKIPALISIRKKMLEDGAVGFIVDMAKESGLIELIASDPVQIHVWRGIMALSESLAREGNFVSPAELINALLAYKLSSESKTVKVSIGAPDLPIKAMTAHGSKGLEFDYVFLPYATEESWVGRLRGASFVLPEKKTGDNDIRDIRRLFYVALTRARKHVAILSALEESDGKSLTPLRFIYELDKKNTTDIVLSQEEIELSKIDLSSETKQGKPDSLGASSNKIINLAKSVLLETGLSVTALNHFLECPNKFIYLSILKLPQAPSAPAEKGTAMHEAISRVWGEKDRSAGHILEVIKDSVSKHLESSFLPLPLKEAVKKELFDKAQEVAKALEAHFNVPGPIFTEHWVKVAFDGQYLGDKIALPLHGKLDAIVEAGQDVLVFDYKTRQAMSVNKIKGDTKDSNGDYFRQLIFYRILLSDGGRWKNRNVTPSLVFVSPDDKGRCPTVTLAITAEDIETVKKEIQSVIDMVWSGAILSAKCSESDCEWCALRSLSS